MNLLFIYRYNFFWFIIAVYYIFNILNSFWFVFWVILIKFYFIGGFSCRNSFLMLELDVYKKKLGKIFKYF